MENDMLWRIIAYGYFATSTLCLLLLIEILLLGRPYVSLFLLIFSGTLYLNWKVLGKNISAAGKRK